MFPLFALIRQLFQSSPRAAVERHEAYLAKAVDMADLERRMRQLDRGERDPSVAPIHGVFSH